MLKSNQFDVIIIGGSYAGLSAAMSLGRSLRSVLIIDGGLPCNRQTPHSHNFLTQDGEQPHVIAERARAQVKQYPTVSFHTGFATNGKKVGNGYEIVTEAKEKFVAQKLIFATGISDIMPEIKGFAECWGISVIHCPYCHGYEFREKKIGIMAIGERGFHLAALVRNLTGDVTMITSGQPGFETEQITKLRQHQIQLEERVIVEIVHEKGLVNHIIFEDGSQMNFDAIYAGLPFEQHSDIPLELGCRFTEQGFIEVDAFQKTSVKGIFACGDNSSMMRSVANAVASGSLAGASVNRELTEESF